MQWFNDRRSVAAHLLRLRVRIPPGGIVVCVVSKDKNCKIQDNQDKEQVRMKYEQSTRKTKKMWLVAAVSPRRSVFDPRLALLKELAMRKVFLVSTSVVPCPYHFTDSPNSFMSTGCSYLTKYRGSLGGKKRMHFRKSGSIGQKSTFILV